MYYIAVDRTTGKYFTWEHDENFNVLGETVDDISKAIYYDDDEYLRELLKLTKNINESNFDIVEMDCP
jgi:hypothetical protein